MNLFLKPTGVAENTGTPDSFVLKLISIGSLKFSTDLDPRT